MNKKLRWVTETAILLALLVTLQALTKGFGQLVTGSCVNAVLAVAVLVAGPASGVTVALISPVLAFLLGIAPMPLAVPVIMVGNTAYVLVLWLLAGRTSSLPVRILGWAAAAAVKFAVLWLLAVGLICNLLRHPLMEAGILQTPMLKVLPATFSWPQLVTALIGGALALVIAPTLKKALRK